MASGVLQGIINELSVSWCVSREGGSGEQSAHRDRLNVVNGLASQLQSLSPSPGAQELSMFLNQAHDLHIKGDSMVRSTLLRALRFSLSSKAHVDAMIQEEWHYLVVTSMERSQDFILERMQALKVVKKCMLIAPSAFPIAFTRSLVAIFGHVGNKEYKEDNLRRVVLETLRELCLVNARSVVIANGVTCMLEAVLDPNFFDMIEPIVHTFMYILNDPQTRRLVRPFLDLRTLIAPFTDLDTEEADLLPKWKAAKTALVAIMRSWVGIVQMTSDDLGLPTLVRMLRDNKVSSKAQDFILDAIAETFEPIFSRVKNTRNLTQFHHHHRHRSSASSSSSSSGLFGPDVATGGAEDLKKRMSRSSSHGSLLSSAASGGAAFLRSVTSSENLHKVEQRPPVAVAPAPAVVAAPAAPEKKSFFTSLFGGGKANASPAPKSSAAATRASISSIAPLDSGKVTFVKSSAPPLKSVEKERRSYFDSRISEGPDPIFNIMDNYAAIISCAFIHSEVIESLCYLGTHGELALANKSRGLMVEILRTVAHIFPDGKCADLLVVPSLIEFAASSSAKNLVTRAHKASQILTSFADAFSMSSFEVRTQQDVGTNQNAAALAADGGGEALGMADLYRGSISGRDTASAMSPGNGGGAGGAASAAGRGEGFRSAFQSSVNTIRDLADELKMSSHSRTSGSSGQLSVTKTDVMQELRQIMSPAIDKQDFNRQMDISKVIGKEGKEPFRWDWSIINDMLEYSFQTPERLNEAMKSKWVRRVSGFYRCTTDEKGYFANLEWEPANLQFLECACNMYFVLVEDPNGAAFLRGDRRGMLFTEMANEIKDLSEFILRPSPPAPSVIPSSATVPSGIGRFVFRLSNCQQTMSREFFALLGRFTRSASGRTLLDSTPMLHHLSSLGSVRNLDYLSRLAVTALTFTDGGFYSRHMLKNWALGRCSRELKIYIHSLLSSLLHSRPEDFRSWGIDVIVSMLSSEEQNNMAPSLVRLVEQAVMDKDNLRVFISKNPDIFNERALENVRMRFMAIPEGIEYLARQGGDWVDSAFARWQESECREYVSKVELLLIKGLSKNFIHRQISSVVSPIAVTVKDYTPQMATQKTGEFYPQSSASSSSSSFASAAAAYSRPSSSPADSSSSSSSVDLEGFLRTPWNIEVKLALHTGFQSSFSGSIPAGGLQGLQGVEHLKVDCFLDASDLATPSCSEITADCNRLVKVRGIILDEKGLPSGKAIANNKSVFNCLLTGMCPVKKTGVIVLPTPNNSGGAMRVVRRRSSNATGSILVARESLAAGMGGVNRKSLADASAAGSIASLVAADTDPAITQFTDHLQDWSHCKPGHRQGNTIELGDNRFSVEIQGEPCVWIFSRVMPGSAHSSSVSRARAGSLTGGDSLFGNSANRSDASRSGGICYLVEVQYYLRLETGQATFATIPRHLYGEVARSPEGISLLTSKNTISDLLTAAHAIGENITATAQKAALWALGNIGSTEFGYSAITAVDSTFLEWCLEGVLTCPNYSVRGTFFQVIGLLSRTHRGRIKLAQFQWDSALSNGSSAVAVPRNPSVLFMRESMNDATHAFDSSLVSQPIPPMIRPLTLNLPHGSVSMELEVLNLIAKLPGNLCYLESKSTLFRLRINHPEIFASRDLYLGVHRLLETYSYKLALRRDILKLFPPEARLRTATVTIHCGL